MIYGDITGLEHLIRNVHLNGSGDHLRCSIVRRTATSFGEVESNWAALFRVEFLDEESWKFEKTWPTQLLVLTEYVLIIAHTEKGIPATLYLFSIACIGFGLTVSLEKTMIILIQLPNKPVRILTSSSKVYHYGCLRQGFVYLLIVPSGDGFLVLN